MDTITRFLKRPPYDGSAVNHEVYLRHEADRAGITYSEDYRNAENGDWVVTKDGWVGQLLLREYRETTKPYKGIEVVLTFSFAYDSFFIPGKTPEEAYALLAEKGVWGDHVKGATRTELEYLPYKVIGGGYGHRRPMSWVDDILRRTRGKIAMQMVADRMVLHDFRLTDKDYHDIGMVLDPHDKIPAAKAKLVLRQPKIQDVVIRKTAEILTEKGLDMSFVLQTYKNAIDVAQTVGNAKSMMEGADRIRDILEKGGVDQAEGANWELLERTSQAEPKVKRIETEIEEAVEIEEAADEPAKSKGY
jgi:hypothetical protein